MIHPAEYKIQLIDEYVSRADAVIVKGNIRMAKEFLNELHNVFIVDSSAAGYVFDWTVRNDNDTATLLQKVRIYRGRLLLFKCKLQEEYYHDLTRGMGSNEIVLQDYRGRVSIDMVIDRLNHLQEDVLPDLGKEGLFKKLAVLSGAFGQSKERRWENAKEVLEALTHENAAVASAVLPYLGQAIQKIATIHW